jgi:hypothetical protein
MKIERAVPSPFVYRYGCFSLPAILFDPEKCQFRRMERRKERECPEECPYVVIGFLRDLRRPAQKVVNVTYEDSNPQRTTELGNVVQNASNLVASQCAYPTGFCSSRNTHHVLPVDVFADSVRE